MPVQRPQTPPGLYQQRSRKARGSLITRTETLPRPFSLPAGRSTGLTPPALFTTYRYHDDTPVSRGSASGSSSSTPTIPLRSAERLRATQSVYLPATSPSPPGSRDTGESLSASLESPLQTPPSLCTTHQSLTRSGIAASKHVRKRSRGSRSTTSTTTSRSDRNSSHTPFPSQSDPISYSLSPQLTPSSTPKSTIRAVDAETDDSLPLGALDEIAYLKSLLPPVPPKDVARPRVIRLGSEGVQDGCRICSKPTPHAHSWHRRDRRLETVREEAPAIRTRSPADSPISDDSTLASMASTKTAIRYAPPLSATCAKPPVAPARRARVRRNPFKRLKRTASPPRGRPPTRSADRSTRSERVAPAPAVTPDGASSSSTYDFLTLALHGTVWEREMRKVHHASQEDLRERMREWEAREAFKDKCSRGRGSRGLMGLRRAREGVRNLLCRRVGWV